MGSFDHHKLDQSTKTEIQWWPPKWNHPKTEGRLGSASATRTGFPFRKEKGYEVATRD